MDTRNIYFFRIWYVIFILSAIDWYYYHLFNCCKEQLEICSQEKAKQAATLYEQAKVNGIQLYEQHPGFIEVRTGWARTEWPLILTSSRPELYDVGSHRFLSYVRLVMVISKHTLVLAQHALTSINPGNIYVYDKYFYTSMNIYKRVQ